MDRQMSKAELLDRITSEHEQLAALVQSLTDEQLVEPGLESNWSIKDMLAHITSWEQRMLTVLESARRGEAPPSLRRADEDWDAALDRLNQETFIANRDRSLDDVRESFQRAFEQSLAAINALDEAEIFDAGGMGSVLGRPAVEVIRDNTYEHYQEHTAAIREWLAIDPARGEADTF